MQEKAGLLVLPSRSLSSERPVFHEVRAGAKVAGHLVSFLTRRPSTFPILSPNLDSESTTAPTLGDAMSGMAVWQEPYSSKSRGVEGLCRSAGLIHSTRSYDVLRWRSTAEFADHVRRRFVRNVVLYMQLAC